MLSRHTKPVLIRHPRTPYRIAAVKLGDVRKCCATRLRKGGYKILHIDSGVALAMLKHLYECHQFALNFECGLTDPHEKEVLNQLDWVRACRYERQGESNDRVYTELYALLRRYTDGLLKVKSDKDQFKHQPEFVK